jgi:hypothetical protein
MRDQFRQLDFIIMVASTFIIVDEDRFGDASQCIKEALSGCHFHTSRFQFQGSSDNSASGGDIEP